MLEASESWTIQVQRPQEAASNQIKLITIDIISFFPLLRVAPLLFTLPQKSNAKHHRPIRHTAQKTQC